MAFSSTYPTLAFDSGAGGSITDVRDAPREAAVYQRLATLQVVDVASTWIILANWTARAEGNPVVSELIHRSGLVAAMLTLLVVKLAVVFVLYEKQTGVKLMSALYGLVVANNLLFLGLWIFG